ncbi:SH3 domain-containing protein [Mycena alexandri]|uniref:SH3 domain-containing protein n=1 Tax=Mycena alexandri TaxID=1745969 RepID=A0AAD6SB28_9AGAR|nr:SH3 domain-containing protein [Mycena alexandri]
MSARRQPSTTSLSKYVRGAGIGPHDRSTDFCNAFWGLGDGGVEVLFARMRGASRTTDELRNFWKERAAIEDDYAKRLAKLSKQVLGRDEIGELRNSLDTIRLETERQASYHLTLSQQVRADLEAQASTFYAKQQHHKKQYQTAIEKEFKAKQQQEAYVTKAREKYETDCMRINSYTAQLGLVQGKDAEKIHLKLERAQQTVVSNERDFGNFARALADTVAKWEQDWKIFCDSCQDLEADRLEFTKDNMWAYANAVSTVCVSDDESCEKMRLALEQMEPDKDMENFVRDYGTGNQIPDPPAFVDFTDPNAIPSSSSRPTFRTSNFPRSSQRPPPVHRNSAQPEEEEPQGNIAGVGLPGSARRGEDPAAASASTQNHRTGTAPIQEPQQPPPQQLQHQQPNGFSPTGNGPDVSRQATRKSVSPSYRVPPRDPMAEPIDPTADTFIKVGPNAYKVDLTKDPTQSGASSSRGVLASSPQNGIDPLAKQMEDLQSKGTVRRRSTRGTSRRGTMDAPPPQNAINHNPHTRPSSSLSLAAPGPSSSAIPQNQQRAQSPGRDYRHSAEAVVGSHPSASRPASPNPITAAFMRPGSAAGPPSSEIIADVLTDYHQSLPGERKSVSRSNSRRGSYASATGPSPSPGPSHAYNASQSSQQSYGQGLTRPPSQGGFAGVGTPGGSRSASPQPMSRGPSPAPVIANVRHSFIAPPAQQSGSMGRSGAASPNNLGIALDSSGRVIHDEMAQRYQQQQQQQHRQSMQPVQTQQPPYNPHTQPQRRLSYMGPGAIAAPPPPQQQYNAVTPYQPQQAVYNVPPPPPLQSAYTPAPVPYQAPPPQQQQVYQPQPHANSYTAVNALQRGVSAGGGYFPPQQQQVSPHQQQLVRAPQQQQQQQQLVRAPQQQQMQLQPLQQAPVRRSPSPNRNGEQPQQQTADGKWILFYVKALFNYAATIDEEFDFQEGDIIAVTATPEDGWWSGELLDENRRVPGKHIFPSNFVVLF